jgi:hypothetical protein
LMAAASPAACVRALRHHRPNPPPLRLRLMWEGMPALSSVIEGCWGSMPVRWFVPAIRP